MMDNDTVIIIVKGVLEAIGLVIAYLKIRDHMNLQERKREARSQVIDEKISHATTKVEETKQEIISTRDINAEQIKTSNNFNQKLLKLQQALARIDANERRTARDVHDIKDNLDVLSTATGIAIKQEESDGSSRHSRHDDVQEE